ncbi:hypothetical protein [Dyadobacter sp. 3J3]|uniref:hypothetical protein n=1 Tax=Dyadobacter sp. 3J3 TaxID=2606600 RepID=UPI00135C327D|nr:hypothetical protein [Dyadobacter sp. 3J3]
MKVSKKVLFYLFLAVMVFGAIINIIYPLNEDLYSNLHSYQKWFLIGIAILTIVNEIRNWNKPNVNFENQQENASANSITLGRKKIIAMVGMGIALIGLVLLLALDSPLPGSITTSGGLLILYYSMYLFWKK